jgi:hypothetical protein
VTNKIKALAPNSASKEITPLQGRLDLGIEMETEIGGIGMGVLSDGTPYLNQRGLAALCGVQNAHIGTISSQWNENPEKPRIRAIKGTLEKIGYASSKCHLEVPHKGVTHFCYPAEVCLAVLEYYAFDAGANCQPEARDNYRILAGSKLREFIYTQVGYSPAAQIPVSWKMFHDRVSLVYHTVPRGYFSVFKEIADIIVTLIRAGATPDHKFVPDISVGQHWGRHWSDGGFDFVYGDRIKYEHNYPDYFPQSASNPQAAYCYPDNALGEFRRWMHEIYLRDKFVSYLTTKERQGVLPPSFSQIALRAMAAPAEPKLITSS